MTNTYETIFICSGDLSQDRVESALEKTKSVISRSQGQIVTAELWGRRRLAYPVERNREGQYAYIIFNSPSTAPSQLEHHYRVTDSILRGLTVKVDPRHLEKIKPAIRAAAQNPEQQSETLNPSEPAKTDPKDSTSQKASG